MDYQARLNDILEKVRKGGVYDVMPEYERQSDYLDTDVAQEAITSLFSESVDDIIATTANKFGGSYSDLEPEDLAEIIDKWQTNQEDGE